MAIENKRRQNSSNSFPASERKITSSTQPILPSTSCSEHSNPTISHDLNVGLTYDYHLTWTPHLKYITTTAYNRLNLLKRLTGTTWGLEPKTILNTFKAFRRPVLTYGHTAWLCAPLSFYRKLNILERHAFRIAYRIKLPSPTADLYARIDFPHIFSFI